MNLHNDRKASIRRVYFVMFNVPDISGGGGAERRYGQILMKFADDPDYQVTLISDEPSIGHLREAGVTIKRWMSIPFFAAGSRWKRVSQWLFRYRLAPLAYPYGAFRLMLLYICFSWPLLRGRCIVHLAFFDPLLLPVLALLSRIPYVKVVQNNQSVFLASDLEEKKYPGDTERDHVIPIRMIRWIRYSGFYSWYRAFCSAPFIHSSGVLCGVAETTFVGLDSAPKSLAKLERKKKNVVMFASRMVETKNPLLYCHAVELLARIRPDVFQNWEFWLFGSGYLDDEIDRFLVTSGLHQRMKRRTKANLCDEYESSSIFLSIQTIENFPSMSLLEAMRSMSAIVATDIGETRRILNESNAFLFQEQTSDSLCRTLLHAIESGDERRKRARNAYETMRSHTIEKFISSLKEFWNQVWNLP